MSGENLLRHNFVIQFVLSNPMLGETFEDSRMKFIAEKVQHNPLEIAYHAEGEHWELSAISCGRTKFWGKLPLYLPRTAVLKYLRQKFGNNTNGNNAAENRNG